MKHISKLSLIAVILLIAGYAPFSSIGFNIDFNVESNFVSNNVVQKITFWVIPVTAFLACFLVFKAGLGAGEKKVLDKVVMYGVLLATVFFSVYLNTLSNEQKILKTFSDTEELFIVGKTYLTAGMVEQSTVKASKYLSRYLIESNSREHVDEAESYLLQLINILGSFNEESFAFLSNLSKHNIKSNQLKEAVYFNLAQHYYAGEGVEKDLRKAIFELHKAADLGHVQSQYNLGVVYDEGIGVEKDSEKSFYWFQEAALQENPEAQAYLGHHYFNGKDGEKDLKKAKVEYRKAADLGHAQSQFNLGVFYEEGLSVKKDIKKAIQWYQLSADQGYSDAQNNLGSIYAKGEQIKTDHKKAVFWFQKAAGQGNATAQANLADKYEKGLGVEKDIEKAISWYQKAADQGSEKAREGLKRIKSK